MGLEGRSRAARMAVEPLDVLRELDGRGALDRSVSIADSILSSADS